MAENVIMRTGTKRSAGRDRGPVDPAQPLPNSAEGLTVDLMNRLVSERHPGSSVTAVELIEAKGLAQQVSTAGRARLRLTYGPGSADLPRDVIVKMVIGEAGVDGALYETEVQIYRDVLRVTFDEPRYGVAPGQAVVCYREDRVLGGGWIE